MRRPPAVRLIRDGIPDLPKRLLAAMTAAILLGLPLLPASAEEVPPQEDPQTEAADQAVETPLETPAEEPPPPVEPAPEEEAQAEEPIAEEPAAEPAPEEPSEDESAAPQEEDAGATAPEGVVNEPVRVANKIEAVSSRLSGRGHHHTQRARPATTEGCDGQAAIGNLRIRPAGSVQATASFTIADGCEGIEVTLASYDKPGGDHEENGQNLTDSATGVFDAGPHTLGPIGMEACRHEIILALGPVMSRDGYGENLLLSRHCDRDCNPKPRATIDFDCDREEDELRVVYSNPEGQAPAPMVLTINGEEVDSLTVAAGESVTRFYSSAPYEDQAITVEVTSGQRVIASETFDVDCEPPPTPEPDVTLAAECVDEGEVTGAFLAITYSNTGTAPADFVTTFDGVEVDALTVPAGSTEVRSYDVTAFEDQTLDIVVVSGNETFPFGRVIDCETPPSTPPPSTPPPSTPPPSTPPPTPNPGVQVATAACVDGATLDITYTNTGSLPAGFVTDFNGVEVDALTVPAGGTIVKSYDVTGFEDQTLSIEVVSGTETFTFTQLIDCEPDTGPTPSETPSETPTESPSPSVSPSATSTVIERPPNPPGPSDGPDEDPEVLGAPPTALPFTGSTLPMWLAWALGLMGAGLALVGLARKRGSGGDERNG
ncbi:MAG: hypothetical protein ACRDKZ_04980 [Actinomycetota bacterium]